MAMSEVIEIRDLVNETSVAVNDCLNIMIRKGIRTATSAEKLVLNDAQLAMLALYLRTNLIYGHIP